MKCGEKMLIRLEVADKYSRAAFSKPFPTVPETAGRKAAQVRLKGTINRDLRRSYEFYDVIASRIHSNGCGKFYRF
jgi:hypothetical protein